LPFIASEIQNEKLLLLNLSTLALITVGVSSYRNEELDYSFDLRLERTAKPSATPLTLRIRFFSTRVSRFTASHR
jgi:hypothetical protein